MKDADRLRALQKRKKTDRVPFYPDHHVRNRSLAWTASAVSPSSSASPRPAASSAPPGPLGVSASAVGKRVARLEEKLGVRLFHRSTRSITPDRRRQPVPRAQPAHPGRDRSLTELELSQSRETPRAAPAGQPAAGQRAGPADARRFRAQASSGHRARPRLQRSRGGCRRRRLRRGPAHRPAGGFCGCPCANWREFQLKLVGSPAYFAHRHAAAARKTCCGTPACTTASRTGRLEEWPLRRADGEAPPQIPVSMVCNNIETRVCFCALRDQGIALPAGLLDPRGAARRAPGQRPRHLLRAPRAFFLLWPVRPPGLAQLRAFIDFCRATGDRHAGLKQRLAGAGQAGGRQEQDRGGPRSV